MTLLNLTIKAICVILALCWSTEATTEAGGNKTELTVKAVQRISDYGQSIKYWDTDNAEVQQAILRELAIGEDTKVPGCPRIRYPMVCDNDKVILENTCYFRMRRRERPGLLPVMVFTSTPIDAARQRCEKGN